MAKRKVTHPRFSKEAIYQLDSLLEFVKPQDLREYLMEIYHQYIIREHEMLPGNFTEIAQSLKVLLEFLKFLEEEQRELTNR